MNSSDKSPLQRMVLATDAGTRLDKWLATWEEISSRSRAVVLIDQELVRVNGKVAKSSLVLREKDTVEVIFPEAKPSNLIALKLDLEILFEDDDLLVVNKPAGLVVHPAAGHEQDTLVNALLAHTGNLSMGFGENRPGIVHRLDKETSGLLVVAKNDFAQEGLVQQFQAREVHRIYQAVCYGEVRLAKGTYKSWIARHQNDRKKNASIRDVKGYVIRVKEPEQHIGKWAVTHFVRLKIAHGMSFLQLKLETGRTHQIRVHLSEEDHPLIGDLLYGTERRIKSLPSVKIRDEIAALPRFLLHARELGFVHPRSGEKLHFEKDWPEPDRKLLMEWGFL